MEIARQISNLSNGSNLSNSIRTPQDIIIEEGQRVQGTKRKPSKEFTPKSEPMPPIPPSPKTPTDDDAWGKDATKKKKNDESSHAWDRDPIEAIEKQLDTSTEQGLTSQEAQKRLREDGPNELWKPKAPGLLTLFLMQLLNIIILLLSASATASIVIQATGDNRDKPISYVEGIAIFTIVILNAGIAAVTENDANNALDALSKMSQPMANVRRDGQSQEVKSVEVVRGDIVLLQTGDICCADLRLIESSELKVNEMLLTGEPDDVAKTSKVKEVSKSAPAKLTPDTMAFSSCTVTNGKATAVVTETGMKTRVGAIAGMLMQEQPTKCGCLPDTSSSQTPLQFSLQKLGVNIGFMAIGVCAVVFIVGLLLGTTDPDNPEKPSWLWMILISVTLAVAAIPEGIPLCVTISLSKGCSSMVEKKVLVRRLAAVETLGSASVICTDKTGTLTEGKMTMVKFWAAGESYDVSGKGFDPTVGCFTKANSGENANKEPGVQSTLLAGLLCCSTKLEKEVDEKEGTIKWNPKGNSSEAPIVVAAAKLGFWESEVSSTYQRILEIPFSSSRKMMVTVCKTPGQARLGENGISLPAGTEVLSICKGAPNFILDLCTSTCDKSGCAKSFDAEAKADVLKVVDDLSSMALRVLAIAIRPMPKLPFDLQDDEVDCDQRFSLLQQDLQFLGLVASVDPERDGVKSAVEAAKDGNIRVVMITGDYVKTAQAIAEKVSILGPDDDVKVTALDCGALRPNQEYLPDDQMDALTHKVKVFARAKPEDKLEIVKSFQRMGLVSAMTGDGVNDAPALKKADIGVAMGIQGTDVAKGASDMILIDDNFANIVAAVEKGRVVYAGIQKFVAFIMSVHVGEVMQIFVCVCAGMPIMRTPLQILFLILVTDLPPAIALGMEPGAKDILKERPRPKTQPIVLKWMWQSILANGAILSVVIIIVFIIACEHYVGSLSIEDITSLIQEEKKLGLTTTSDQLRKARTTAFISVVWSENVRAYTSRSFDRPFFVDMFTNKAMQKAIGLAQAALYVVIFTPVVSKDIFGLQGAIIGVDGWIIAIAGSVVCLLLCELYKFVSKEQINRFRKRVQEQQDKEEEDRLAKFAQEEKQSGFQVTVDSSMPSPKAGA